MSEQADASVVASEDVRRQLLVLAASERTRSVPFSVERPSEWRPGTVRHPETGEAFTLHQSWDFVVAALTSGAELRIVLLRKPPGKKAYEMVVSGYGQDEIYIKLEFGSSKVFGRSFHASKPNKGRS